MVPWHRNIRRTWNGASLLQSLRGSSTRLKASDRKRPTISVVRVILWLGVCLVVMWMSTMAWWSHSVLTTNAAVDSRSAIEQQQQQQQQDIEESSLSIQETDLWPDDYASKNILETLQSCDPNNNNNNNQSDEEDQNKNLKKCQQHEQSTSKGSRQRIGLLFTPGALSYMFTQFIKDVVRLHALPDTDLVLVPTTHVDIEHHDFTKIIRLAILPVILSASDAVLSTLDPSIPKTSVTVEDILGAVRQLLRWHCHVSRVADHIPLMTMTLAELVENPWEAELQVRSFLSLEPHDPNNSNEWAEKHVDEDEMMASLEEMVKYCSSLFEHFEKTTTKIPQLLQAVVEEELKWNNVACKPVRELERGSVVTTTLGGFLSPDSSRSEAICQKRMDAPICKDREAPISSRLLRESAS